MVTEYGIKRFMDIISVQSMSEFLCFLAWVSNKNICHRGSFYFFKEINYMSGSFLDQHAIIVNEFYVWMWVIKQTVHL